MLLHGRRRRGGRRWNILGQIWKHSCKPENKDLFFLLEITLILWEKERVLVKTFFLRTLCNWNYFVLKIRADSSRPPSPNCFDFWSLTAMCTSIQKYSTWRIGLSPHLFVKVPRPGDSEVTCLVFESSCHLLLPV